MNLNPNVLCVDDEPMNLEVLQGILMPHGYEVVLAASGKNALKIIDEQKIDLVLLDVMMPEMNGYEVCRIIKEDESHCNTPIIMITALESREDRIKGIESGSDDFITKPFNFGEVLARIKMLLKMKNLNESLRNAYSNISSLNAFGEEIISNFNPNNFNFINNIDSLVNKIIRKNTDTVDNPQILLVGIYTENNCYNLYKYEFDNNLCGMNKTLLDPDFQSELNKRKSAKIYYINQSDFGKKENQTIKNNLNSYGINISNLVGYHTDSFCIMAINYGRNVNPYDASLLDSMVMQTLFLRSLSMQVKEIEESFSYTVHALARAAEVNDEDTGDHIIRVGKYSEIIAKEMKMPDNFIKEIALQAQTHDVGKIHVSPAILKKPGEFTREEWEEMKRHTLYGAKILGDHPRFAMARRIALSHHERWDGSGYPYGLKGNDIPIEGRIINIADQYDALRNARVYKPPFDHKKSCSIIIEGDGRSMPQHFDPQVLKTFQEKASQFEELYQELTMKT